MSSWIDAITSPLKAAGEMAQGLIDLRDQVKFGDAVVKLQAQIMAAQQGAFAVQSRATEMAEEVSRLKRRVAEVEGWDAEKERYELVQIAPGNVAYALKESARDGVIPAA